jgi:excisionase family DNA binding protein
VVLVEERVMGKKPTVNGQVGPPAGLEDAVRRAMQADRDLPAELTTAQAAVFLNVTQSAIGKLVKEGRLPCRVDGKRRLILTEALRQQREKMYLAAREGAAEITRISQELGMDEGDPVPPRKR